MTQARDPVRARVTDAMLQASVVGSYSKLGPALRSRAARWEDPRGLAGRQVVVTGATSGLGLATARRLCHLGADVCLVGRRADRLASAAATLQGPGTVTQELADLEDLEQVGALGERLRSRPRPVEVLVHNAGALLRRYHASPQGTETTVTVHLLAPYVLTECLMGSLSARRHGRVITVTSGGLYTQRFSLEKLVAPPEAYHGAVAYARAKRAQLVLTAEWQRRYGPRGVDFCTVDPGWVDTPGLATGLPRFSRLLGPLLRTPEQGCDTVVWLAGNSDRPPCGGGLWLDRRPRTRHLLPWTRPQRGQRQAEGQMLWEWCRQQVAGARG